MPLIEVELFDGRLNPQTETKLIEGLTEVIVDTFGQEAGDATWIILRETSPNRWGFAGRSGRITAADTGIDIEGKNE